MIIFSSMSFSYKFTTRKNSDAVHIQLITARVKTKFSTGVKGNLKNFSEDFARFSKKEIDHAEKNARLQALEERLDELQSRLVHYPDPALTNAKVKKLLSARPKSARTLRSLGEEVADRANMAASSRKMFDSFLQGLETYAPGATTADLNEAFIAGYKAHIERENNKPNTIRHKLLRLKSVINHAIEEGHVRFDLNPFRHVKIPGLQFPYRSELTPDEIRLLEQCDQLKESERLAIDLFLFQYYTAGLRASDALQMTTGHIKGGQFVFVQQKTQHLNVLPVTDKAREFMRKYNHLYIVPLLPRYNAVTDDEQRKRAIAYINKVLKRICKRLGIQKHVTTHTARHSFTKQADRERMAVGGITKALGQKSPTVVDTYMSASTNITKEALEAVYGKGKKKRRGKQKRE